MPTSKALGMTVYVSTTTTTSGLFTTLCAVSVDGGGVENSVESLEPCLDDTIILEFPADPKYSQQTIEYKKVETTANDGVSAALEAACLAGTMCEYSLKVPLATPVYATKQAYIISHTDMSKERNQEMKCSLVLAPQSDWTYSTQAPATV